MTYIEEYYNKIMSGEIQASKWVKKQYQMIIPIVRDEDKEYMYDDKKGSVRIEFGERFCKLSKDDWNGQPMEFLLWQKAATQAIYGIVHRSTGLRKYQNVTIVVAKKNGKSTMMDPLVIFELMRKGQEIYSAADALQQSKIIFEEVHRMITQSPALKTKLKKRQFDIVNKADGNFSKFQPLANTPTVLDGKYPTMIVFDEFWNQPNNALYSILKNGMVSVKEPLFFMISTKGNVRLGLFDEQYDFAKKVLEGVIKDETQFSLIYELDKEEELYDETKYVKANPSIPYLLTTDRLKAKLEEGRMKPRTMAEIKMKHFNIGAQKAEGIFDYEKIKNEETIDYKEHRREMVVGGCDMSRTNDLTAWADLWWSNKYKKYFANIQMWCTQDFYDKILMDTKLAESFKAWHEEGWLKIAGKALIDHKEIIKHVNDNIKKYGWIYRFIGYDSYSSTGFVSDMIAEGFREKECMIPVIQGFKTLSVPLQGLIAELNEHNIVYNNNPMFEWCLTNVTQETDRNGNMMPKKTTNAQKIDGFAALLNAFTIFQNNQNVLK